MNASSEGQFRRLGKSDLMVSSIGFGCWPIAGVTSLGVNDQDSLATLRAAIDCGINFFDTAYGYGLDGEADHLLARVVSEVSRSDLVIASKVGQFLDGNQQRVIDGSPSSLHAQTETLLSRLGTDEIDLLYLHFPDPDVPIEDSAGAIKEIVDGGRARAAGVSNMSPEQVDAFHAICPVTAVQPPFNMFQQSMVEQLRPFCTDQGIAVVCYWVLMKGLLAGKMLREHRFDPADKRLKYPIFQGDNWRSAQDLLDVLRRIASDLQVTVAQLVVAWTLQQPGISVALCGAKRPEQIRETAEAMQLQLMPDTVNEISDALKVLNVDRPNQLSS